VGYVCNPSTLEAEAGRSEFEASLDYVVTPYLKKQKTKMHIHCTIIKNKGNRRGVRCNGEERSRHLEGNE
jgi:hypothetical protein